MTRTAVHIVLHFLAPGLLARLVFPGKWRRAWLIMLLTMAVDLDHLAAVPVFDPGRCSIGFHPLHSRPALAVYLLLPVIPALRIIGAGLLLHMATDLLDCLWPG